MDDPSEQVLSWFEDDELTDCPSCGERKVVPAPAGKAMLVCAVCGIVTKPTPNPF
jgi:transcription elongation factor Elf1